MHVHEGALVQPAALVRGLADTLLQNVRLIEQCPVLQIEAATTIKLHTPQGEISTDKLIMAANYEAVKLGFLSRRLIGSTLSGSFTRQLTVQELASLGEYKQFRGLGLDR